MHVSFAAGFVFGTCGLVQAGVTAFDQESTGLSIVKKSIDSERFIQCREKIRARTSGISIGISRLRREEQAKLHVAVKVRQCRRVSCDNWTAIYACNRALGPDKPSTWSLALIADAAEAISARCPESVGGEVFSSSPLLVAVVPDYCDDDDDDETHSFTIHIDPVLDDVFEWIVNKATLRMHG